MVSTPRQSQQIKKQLSDFKLCLVNHSIGSTHEDDQPGFRFEIKTFRHMVLSIVVAALDEMSFTLKLA